MSATRTILRTLAAIGGGLALLLGGLALPAAAEPETPVYYTSGSTATRVDGLGFDACAAPTLATLQAWQGTSPYKVVNIYFGGNNRGCAQPNLTSGWVNAAAAGGWKLLPTYFGYQPYCMFGNKEFRYNSGNATPSNRWGRRPGSPARRPRGQRVRRAGRPGRRRVPPGS